MSVPPGYPMLLVHHFFDNNGDNAAGYKLYTYAAGTSTPKETFQDSDLTTPNTNPITLDAFGRCTIFVCGGEGYKIKLFTPEGDPGGVLIWTRDNWSVPGVSAPAAAAEIPIGGMIPYGGAAAPTGWLLCNGAAVSRTTYAALFAVATTKFGVGDGSTTFNVPDMRGRFPMGVAAAGTGSVLGATAGAIDHVHTGPSHTHSIPAHSHTMPHTHTIPHDGWSTAENLPPLAGVLQAGGSGVGSEAAATQATADKASGGSSAVSTGAQALTTDASGTGNTGTANPPLLALNFIIRAA